METSDAWHRFESWCNLSSTVVLNLLVQAVKHVQRY